MHGLIEKLLKKPLKQGLEDGADEQNRTADLLITNQLLYQLSYIGLMWRVAGNYKASLP